MAYLVNLYSDWLCKNPKTPISVGVAGVTGKYANLTNWTEIASYNEPEFDGVRHFCYTANLYSSSEGASGFAFGGGSAVYDFDFSATTPFQDKVITDKRANSDSSLVYNPAFTGRGGKIGTTTVATSLGFFTPSNSTTFGNDQDLNVQFLCYSQTPDTGTRTTWNYRYNDYMFYLSRHFPANSAYSLVKFYKITISDKNFILIACGVDNNGSFAPTSYPTLLILIPEIYFEDKPVVPYVGPVSKESAESAYIGNPVGTDSISSRDLSAKKNPFGFNSGGTMYLSEITAAVYHSIVSGIYDGTSGSPLNALGQVVSGIVGGNTHRPAEEIDAMIKGVLCCHIVPTITTYTTGSPVAIYTISGYQIKNTALAANAVNQICTLETAAFAVKRINGSFLDFEPYTTIDLVVPFLGTVRIPASVIIDKAVKIRFAIDLLSGTLSADIIISEVGRSWVYTTLQGNCAVDMPIMGAGANANPLLKIASAAGGIATGGTLGAAAGVFNIIDGAASAAFSQPVGKCNMTNIGAFMSPRDIALIIHTPSPSNAQDFGVIVGTPSNMSGKVGDFKGYTEFVDVDLNTVNGATDGEKEEIKRILMGGVFL